MTAHQPNQDPQDRQFGAAAAADQELVDQLADEGVPIDTLSDTSDSEPRAGNKAPPANGQDG